MGRKTACAPTCFTWQEERRLTDNLTLHYKRVMYVVEHSDAAKPARGKGVVVVESEDGSVRIEYGGVELVARAFPKAAALVPWSRAGSTSPTCAK